MRHTILVISFVLFSTSAWADSKGVCETFTDAEIADLFGAPPTVKRSILGPATDCLWGINGLSLNISRIQDNEPDVIKGVVDSQLRHPREGDVVKAEPGIGDAAVSNQERYGRSVSLIFRSGHTAWTFHLEQIDQKLDAAVALPKLRTLARKAAATP